MKTNERSIWQEADDSLKKELDLKGIKAVAQLKNAKGRPFGQILIGKPSGKMTLEKRDLAEIESVINLIASIIDSAERLRK